jgi:hypothetical protein
MVYSPAVKIIKVADKENPKKHEHLQFIMLPQLISSYLTRFSQPTVHPAGNKLH